MSASPRATSIAARNKANAQHSTGPRSATGKAAASRNAVKHGLLSTQPLALPSEDQAAMDAHRDDYVAVLGASGAVQIDLAERASYLVWRLSRLARYKHDLLAPPDPNRPPRYLNAAPAPQYPDAATAKRYQSGEDPQCQAIPQYPDAALTPQCQAIPQCPNAATAKRYQSGEDPQCQALDVAGIQAELDEATFLVDRLRTWGRLPAEQPFAPRSATAILTAYANAVGDLDEVLPLLPDYQPGQSIADYCAAPIRTAAEWKEILPSLAERSGLTWSAASFDAYHSACNEVRRLTALLSPPLPPPPPPLPAPQPAPALLPDLDTLERLVRYETCLARELSRALRELRQLKAADRTFAHQTNPTPHLQPAAAGVVPARPAGGCPAQPEARAAATASLPLPRAVDGTNPPAAPPQPAAAGVVPAIRPQPEALQAAAGIVPAIRPLREASRRSTRRNPRRVAAKRRR